MQDRIARASPNRLLKYYPEMVVSYHESAMSVNGVQLSKTRCSIQQFRVFFRENDQVVVRSGKSLVNEIHATCFYSHAPKWYFSSKYPVWGRVGQVIGTSWFVGRVMVRLSKAIRQDL